MIGEAGLFLYTHLKDFRRTKCVWSSRRLTFYLFGRRAILEDGHFLALADGEVDGLASDRR